MTKYKDYIIIAGDRSNGQSLITERAWNKIVADLYPKHIISVGDQEWTTVNTAKYVGNGLDRWSFLSKLHSSPGNHDRDNDGTRNGFNSWFGGGGYRKVIVGYIDFFLYDVLLKEDGGYYTYTEFDDVSEATFKATTQGQWLLAQLAASTNVWKIVVIHPMTWSSNTNASATFVPGMRWDWAALGVDMLIHGHQHYYERLTINTGSGNVAVCVCPCAYGAGIQTDGPVPPDLPIAGSQKILSGANTSTFYDADCYNGYIHTLLATQNSLAFETWGLDANFVIKKNKDSVTLTK